MFRRCEQPTGFKHPVEARDEPSFVGDIHRDVLAPNHVERLVGIREIERIADLQHDTVGKLAALGQHSSGLDQFRVRSMPSTRQPYVCARYRAGPPMPQPTSRTRLSSVSAIRLA